MPNDVVSIGNLYVGLRDFVEMTHIQSNFSQFHPMIIHNFIAQSVDEFSRSTSVHQDSFKVLVNSKDVEFSFVQEKSLVIRKSV